MRRTKAEAAETKAAILVGAEQIFFEKGFTAATFDDIAAEAKVTRGAIYWHFESKNDLFLELYNSSRLAEAVTMVDVERSICDERNALAVIEQACFEWLKVLAHDQRRQRMLTILLRTNVIREFPQVAQEMEALDDSYTQDLENTLATAARNERLAPAWTPKSSSVAVKWLIKGITNEWLLSGHKFDLVKDGSDSIKRLFASFRQN